MGPKLLAILFFNAGFLLPRLISEPAAKRPTIPMVNLTGKVISSDAAIPLSATPVITYETLPNGSDYGITYLKDGQMNFQFPIRRNVDYKICAKAPGFTASTKVLSDLENSAGDVYVEFVLNPARKGEVLRLQRLIFEQGKHEILAPSLQELEDLIITMNVNPGMIVQLEGHTDVRGNEDLNMDLSKKRVSEVKDFLTARGIASSRVKTKAFGEKYPLVRRGSDEERKINRRVEVRILEM